MAPTANLLAAAILTISSIASANPIGTPDVDGSDSSVGTSFVTVTVTSTEAASCGTMSPPINVEETSTSSGNPFPTITDSNSAPSTTPLIATSAFNFMTTHIIPPQQKCNQDNCYRQFLHHFDQISGYCETYILSIDTETIGLPTYVSQCHAEPSRISSACSCLVIATSADPVSTSTAVVVPIETDGSSLISVPSVSVTTSASPKTSASMGDGGGAAPTNSFCVNNRTIYLTTTTTTTILVTRSADWSGTAVGVTTA